MGNGFRFGGLAGTAVFLLAGLTLTPPGRTQPAAMKLLTDTPHYCAELSAEVEAARQALVNPAPAAVEKLAREGRQLCALGEVRAGIIRLRRAIVVVRQSSGRS
ncbi:MAG: hypothetical protein M0002_09410 [Rhodospirillales bacterium]|nr:hypothetical protein [Rhodospirillales bacterium]